MSEEQVKAVAEAEAVAPPAPEEYARAFLVILKRPVKLPTSLIDAIREGAIEKITAL